MAISLPNVLIVRNLSSWIRLQCFLPNWDMPLLKIVSPAMINADAYFKPFSCIWVFWHASIFGPLIGQTAHGLHLYEDYSSCLSQSVPISLQKFYLQIYGCYRLLYPFGVQLGLTFYGAWDGNRTRTRENPHGILSPMRLPIPPPRHGIILF